MRPWQGMAWLAEKAAAAPDLDSSAGASGCGADSKRRLDGAGQRWTRDLPAGAVAASGVPPRTRADWAGSGGGAGSSGSATDAHDTRANANSESWGTLPEARARNAAGIVGQAHAVRALGAPAPGAPRLPPESAGSALQRASSNRFWRRGWRCWSACCGDTRNAASGGGGRGASGACGRR